VWMSRARKQRGCLRGGKGRTRPPLQPPHLFQSATNRPRGRRGDHNVPGITRPDLAGCASVLHSEFTSPRQALGGASSSPCRGGDRKGEARTDPRTANSERCFWMSLSLGGGSLVQCHGGSATDCTAPPCWSQIVYTSRSSCDLRRCPAPDRGNRPDIPGVPPQTTACNRSPPTPPSRRAGPTTTGKEVISGTCHGSAPVA
jgi:hypothetical protein